MDFIADYKDVQFAILRFSFDLRFFKVFFLLPAILEELRQRITTALQTVTQDMLQRFLGGAGVPQ